MFGASLRLSSDCSIKDDTSERGVLGHQEPIVPLGHVMCGSEGAVPSFLASPTGGRGTSIMFPQGAGFNKIKRNEPILVDTVGIRGSSRMSRTVDDVGPIFG
jgi:hypothetical protein